MRVPDQTLDYNLALLPTERVSNLAITTSNYLSHPDGKTYFSLGEQHVPHITLTMARFLVRDQVAIEQALHDIAMTTAPQHLQAASYGGGDRFINVTYETTPALSHLEQRVLLATNTLRFCLPPKQAGLLEPIQDQEIRRDIETYGFQSIGDRWKPHITLTRYRKQVNRDSVIEAELPPLAEYDDISYELALCTLGDNGTVSSIVARFALQGTNQADHIRTPERQLTSLPEERDG